MSQNQGIMMLNISVFTLFPELFPGALGVSVTGRGLKNNAWTLETINIRDFAEDKYKTVDDTPFGGGPGMVMRPDVISRALTSHYGERKPGRLIYLSPRGKPLTQSLAKELAKSPSLGLLCGRFEGVDQRVLDTWKFEEVSIGDYVLTGGELAAQVLIDSCVRHLSGVLGSADSLTEESFSQGLVEYPQYTRPQEWNGQRVPDVLNTGHHEKIRKWRHEESEKMTQKYRPELWEAYLADRQDSMKKDSV